MTYIEIEPNQAINLMAKRGATVTQALHEAINFCRNHSTEQCDLYYQGFTFGIEPDSDIAGKVKEYADWKLKQ